MRVPSRIPNKGGDEPEADGLEGDRLRRAIGQGNDQGDGYQGIAATKLTRRTRP